MAAGNEAGGHAPSAVRDECEPPPPFFHLCLFRAPSPWEGTATPTVGLPSAVSYFWKLCRRHTLGVFPQ